jgi:hypothetical protein
VTGVTSEPVDQCSQFQNVSISIPPPGKTTSTPHLLKATAIMKGTIAEPIVEYPIIGSSSFSFVL